MPYDQTIQERIDALYDETPEFHSKRMFGGVGYMYDGNMAFGIWQDYLIVRLGDAAKAQAAFDSGKAVPFDVTGTPMKGWIMVPGNFLKTDDDYLHWLKQGLDFAQSLPAK